MPKVRLMLRFYKAEGTKISIFTKFQEHKSNNSFNSLI